MVTILFLAANPRDQKQLRVEEEFREIEDALRESEYRDKFKLEHRWALRVEDLHKALLRYKPDIVHFSGHGSKFREIILEDTDGNYRPVSITALGNVFSVLKDNIHCVVLNACYSEEQAREIGNHIDCVIGMSDKIGDKSSIKFSTAFYSGLGYGRDIQTSFNLGCSRINLEGLGDADKPKLLCKNTKNEIKFTNGISTIPPEKSEIIMKTCAYCKGTARDPGSIIIIACPICKGEGQNLIPSSAKPCRYCGGSGRDPGSILIIPCHICRGTGFK